MPIWIRTHGVGRPDKLAALEIVCSVICSNHVDDSRQPAAALAVAAREPLSLYGTVELGQTSVHTGARFVDGTVRCSGDNAYGQSHPEQRIEDRAGVLAFLVTKMVSNVTSVQETTTVPLADANRAEIPMTVNSVKETYYFIAVLLYESTSKDSDKEPMYEESFVLIQSSDEDEARRLALEHANRCYTSYQNAEGESVEWALKHVIDVNRILDDELKHGAELYARHFRNYEAYRNFEPLLAGSVD